MKKAAWLTVRFLAVLVLTLPAAVARADVAIQDLPNVFDEFLIGGDLSVFYRYDYRPYFTTETQSTGVTDDNMWGEIFARLNFTAKKKFPWAEVEAKFSPIFLSTIDQDVYGIDKDDTEVDFNKAYNPPCAFTPRAPRRLPPPPNWMPVRVEAGERTYGKGH